MSAYYGADHLESDAAQPVAELLDSASDPTQPREDDSQIIEAQPTAAERAQRPNFLTATRFADFDLPPEIMAGIDQAGFEYCTPIQAQAIPVALSGQDIAGQAQTGTGKTTAFLVPLLDRLLKNKPLEPDVPRALIVTPTRELALQIYQDALVLAGETKLRQVLVIGGIDYKEQAEALTEAPEIVICTPGRIIDYLQQGIFKTKGIEAVVVDEADRLLDMGFIKDLKYLLGNLPPFSRRQTMLFSATLDDRVLELTYQFMNPPQYITAEPDKNTRVSIEQELYHVGREEKLPLLLGLLRREEHRRVIIFCNTKSGVEWLSKKLTMNGFQAEGITGDLPQTKRLKLMDAFKENRLQILVATDVASRGIHVDDVSHVYNYDLPQDAENYVHRIGRTARAGHDGKAVSFGCEDYVFHLEAIENLLGEKIPVCWAEEELFMEDQGGEVHLKERKGERKRGSGGRSERESSSRGGRGPARSQRPGGIFGLAPRTAEEGADERQILTWSPAPAEEETESLEGAETQGQEAGSREGGRKRKRRRGRRGQAGSEGALTAVSVESRSPEEMEDEIAAASAAEPKKEAWEPALAEEPSLEEAVSEPPDRVEEKPTKPAREKARYPRQRVKRAAKEAQLETELEGGAATELTPEPAAEAPLQSPKAADPKAAPKARRGQAKTETQPEAPEAAAEKPRRGRKPKVQAAEAETSEPKAKKNRSHRAAPEAEAEVPVAEAPEPHEAAAEAKKKAPAKKVPATKTAQEVKEASVKAAPAEADSSKPRRRAAKKAETSAPAKRSGRRKTTEASEGVESPKPARAPRAKKKAEPEDGSGS